MQDLNSKSLWTFIFRLLGADFSGAKGIDVEGNIHHRFSYYLHTISLLIFLPLTAIISFDVYANRGEFINLLLKITGLQQVPQSYVNGHESALLYLFCLPLSVAIALVSALYFFISQKQRIYKQQILNVHIGNPLLSGICQFFGGIPILILMWLGGYLFIVKFFAVFQLDQFVFTQVLQVLLISKAYALISSGMGGMILALLPFKSK